ncbi:hypothetical protein GTP46_19100 [Duganella sp. FT135W]|uniref:Uncharacterized protein n=1 Tax=Duganella flavida TaxID=2692175 RepID=A0A6L8KDK0_9BURK|nr:hypothetical protein [Duganella flavida]MYM24747.1 hypothetical protein [Duganella flavida]
MKPIVIHTASTADRKAYAVRRMNAAAQRLLHANTVAEEIKAGHWVLAWAVAAGARPSSRSAAGSVESFVALNLH